MVHRIDLLLTMCISEINAVCTNNFCVETKVFTSCSVIGSDRRGADVNKVGILQQYLNLLTWSWIGFRFTSGVIMLWNNSVVVLLTRIPAARFLYRICTNMVLFWGIFRRNVRSREGLYFGDVWFIVHNVDVDVEKNSWLENICFPFDVWYSGLVGNVRTYMSR
jgi:hypothetical protein